MHRYVVTADQRAEAAKAARDQFTTAVELARSKVPGRHVPVCVEAFDRYRQRWKSELMDAVMRELIDQYPDLVIQRREQLGLMPGDVEVRYYLQPCR